MKAERLRCAPTHARSDQSGFRPRRLLGAALSSLLIGCGGLPGTPGLAQAHESGAPHEHGADVAAGKSADAAATPIDSQLMYELMLAELAGRRGLLDVATEGYLRAAGKTDDARVAERAAQLALFANRWKDAEKAARRWLVIEPDAAAPQELLAQALMRQSRIDESIDAFEALIAGSDRPAEAVLSDIAGEMTQQPPKLAAEVLEKLRQQHPEAIVLPLAIAQLTLQRQDRTAALQAVDQALAIDAGDPDALLLRARVLVADGKVAEGLKGVEAALDDDETDVPLRLGYARLLVEAGRYGAASPELERLFETADDDPTVLLTIGLLALDARRLGPAERYLERLLGTGEFADQAHYYLGQIDDERQELADAIVHYEAVMPGDLYLNAQVRAAELLATTGSLDTALERIRGLSAQATDDPAVLPGLLSAEARMLQEGDRAEEAVTVLSEGLERFPEDSDLLYSRALAAEAAGDVQMLETDLARLIDAEPDNAHALNALGYHLVNRNERLDEAETYLVKANRLLPDDPAIMDSLGWLRYRQGKLDAATTLLRKAYEQFPDAEIAAHLGEVLWMNGDEEAARQLWDEALVAAPDDDLLNRVVKRFTE